MRTLRLIASFVVAFVLVGTLVSLAIDRYQRGEKVASVKAYQIERLSPAERDAILRLLAESDAAPEPPAPPPAPEFSLPERTAPGFVQLEYSVQPDGSATDIRVVGAVPEGRYDDAARAMVAGRRYAPNVIDGQPVESVRSEVITFGDAPPQSD